MPGVQTIGPARSLPQSASTAATAALLAWQTLADGSKVAALRFQSAGAQGLRLGIVVEQMPAEAVLRFYAPDGAASYGVTGSEVLATIARNQQAGDTSAAARTYWSPDVGGDTVVLEVELPRHRPRCAAHRSAAAVALSRRAASAGGRFCGRGIIDGRSDRRAGARAQSRHGRLLRSRYRLQPRLRQ